MGCNTQEHLQEHYSPDEVEDQVETENRQLKEIQEARRFDVRPSLSRTPSQEDYAVREKEVSRRSMASKSKRLKTISELEQEAEQELETRRKPTKKAPEVSQIETVLDPEDTSPSENRVVFENTPKEFAQKTESSSGTQKPESAVFQKTKSPDTNRYIPEEDNLRLQKGSPLSPKEDAIRASSSQATYVGNTVIAHPRRPYPPSRYVLYWVDQYYSLDLLNRAPSQKAVGSYSRFTFYQELDDLCRRLRYDWVDVSQELAELPTSLEAWKTSETEWTPTDASGESWDYGQKWAYEEDKILKFMLVKSPNSWGDPSVPLTVAYFVVKFDKDRTVFHYKVQRETFHSTAEPVVELGSGETFEGFFNHLDRHLAR